MSPRSWVCRAAGCYPNLSYQSTKGAIVNLTRALAVEWAERGIRVNAVAPTWVSTELTQGLFRDPELLGRVLDLTPMRCLAEPADVAERHRLPGVGPGAHDHGAHASGGRRISRPVTAGVRPSRLVRPTGVRAAWSPLRPPGVVTGKA